MKVKIKRLIEMHNNLSLLKDVDCELVFSHAIAKNRRRLKNELELLEDFTKPSSKYEEYDEKRIKLAAKYAKLDDDGRPIIKDNGYIIQKDMRSTFESEIANLELEYEEAITEFKNKIKQYQLEIEKEIEFDYYMIEFDNIPKLTPLQMEIIFDLVKE
jgi:hypothetical protein